MQNGTVIKDLDGKTIHIHYENSVQTVARVATNVFLWYCAIMILIDIFRTWKRPDEWDTFPGWKKAYYIVVEEWYRYFARTIVIWIILSIVVFCILAPFIGGPAASDVVWYIPNWLDSVLGLDPVVPVPSVPGVPPVPVVPTHTGVGHWIYANLMWYCDSCNK